MANEAQNLMQNVLNSQDEKMADEPNKPDVLMYEQSLEGVKEQVLKEQIIDAMRTVYDPEIPVNIYELGLIYDLRVSKDGKVEVDMTLTSPACPVAGTLPIEVENKIAAVPGVSDVKLDLVWDPPYTMEMMSEAARLQLGLL